MDELTSTELWIYERLIDDDSRALIELLNRKIRAQSIRRGIAA